MADEQAISTSDALNEISRMKNQWRAVEHAEIVLTAVQQAESRKADLENNMKALEDKVTAMQQKHDDTAKALADKEKEFSDYAAELASKKEAAQRQYDADMAEVNAQYSKMTVAAKDKMNEEI